MKRVDLLLALAFLLAPMVALADGVPLLDFAVAPSTEASITYDGQGGPLVGQNISIVSVQGLNTPLNSGAVVLIEGGLLNFMTGALTGTTSNTWSFGGGVDSFISITGGSSVSCYNEPGCDYPPVGDQPWLLYGGFGDATVMMLSPTTSKIAGASFWDYKCWELLAYYGLEEYVWQPVSGNFNISFTTAEVLPPNGFDSTVVLSGDVFNTVPEPGTLALLGTGLLGIAGLVRRKLIS